MTEKIGISLVKTSKSSNKSLESNNFVKINIKKDVPKQKIINRSNFVEKKPILKKEIIEEKLEERLPIKIVKPIIIKRKALNIIEPEEKIPIKIAKPIILKKQLPKKEETIRNKINRHNAINLSKKNNNIVSNYVNKINKGEVYTTVTRKNNIGTNNMNKKRELLKKFNKQKDSAIQSKLITNNSKINTYLILILIAFIFVIILPVFVVNPNWVFSWEIIKTVVFGVGMFLISIFFLLLWALGNIDYEKKFTAYDVTILLFAIGLIILTILNKDISLLWGNVQRPFDSVIIYLALILFYFILRFFVNLHFVKFILHIWSILVIISVTPLILISSFEIKPIGFLQNLFPSYTFLSSSVIQIAILTIISIVSLWYISYSQKGISLIINNIVLLVGVFYYVILLQIIQNQTLLIVSILISIILFGVDLKENNVSKNKFSFKYIVWSITLLIGIVTSVFIKSTSLTQEFYLNFNQGLNYARQSLADSLLYGKGVSYTWNKFLPDELLKTTIWDTDLFNLWSEIFNFIVRVGSFGLPFILIILFIIGLDFIASIVENKSINKEQSLIFIIFILLLFFPMELIAKIGLILLSVLYLGKENFNFPINLWQGKTGLKNYNPQIVSVIGILSFGLIFINFIFVSNFIKAFQAHNLYESAIASTDESTNIEKITESKNKFTNYSLYFEYYIQQETKLLDKKLTEIIQSAEENNTQQISDLNQKIKSLLDEISIQKTRYPYSLSIINSEIDLKFLIKRYGSINDEDILENISLAEQLKPNSPKWDFYRSKLYILSYQTNKNQEFVDKAIEYIEKSLTKNQTYILGYELYADIYFITNDNANQIKVLEKYINIIQKYKQSADVKLVYRLANLYYQEKEYQLSEQLLNVLIRDLPESIDSYILLADVYIAQGEIEKAKFVFEKILEKQPDLEIIKEKLKNL